MKNIYPPQSIVQLHKREKSIFLAGSIEMGKAEDWQSQLEVYFQDLEKYTILNPRRKDWDSSWEQHFESPQFYQQVTWELNALEKADHIILYFCPDTKSPISLLELGLFANSKKLLVCCPKGFWRRGNVEIVCERYDIPFYEHLGDLLLTNFKKS